MSPEEAKLWRMFWISYVKAEAYGYLMKRNACSASTFRYCVAVNMAESAAGAILTLFILGERDDYPA